MSLLNEDLRCKVMHEVRVQNRLIGDVSAEFDISNKQIFDWLKKAEKMDKRTKSLKESGIKRRMAKLTRELETLNLTL